jgi:outer membrane protein assembly factor BamD
LKHRIRQSGRATALTLVAGLVVVGALSGCAGKKERVHLVYEERPVELLYNTGMKRLDDKSWGEANDYFQEVERQHPYSEWSRRAIIMEIYANYMDDKYVESSAAADHFIALYPGSPLTPYAYFMKANNAFEQIVDIGRDQEMTNQALTLLNDVVKRYPTSEYAKDARLKLDMVRDQLAGKEMAIGRYYLNDQQPLAAIGRFRSVITTFQTTSHTPEALYRLVESNLMLGLIDEAQRNAAVLGYNYPGDRWYAAAYKLMAQKGVKPEIKPDPNGAKGSDAAGAKPKKKNFLARLIPS